MYEQEQRKSFIEIGTIYFWTVTINKWIPLLEDDRYKVIIDSLQFLSSEGKVDIFGFVIMPNHSHFIWRSNELNGKESPQGSFLKYTAHIFKKLLFENGKDLLIPYRIDASNKNYEFWQRDPLAIPLFTRKVAEQKLNYIHMNPLSKRWKLVDHPTEYKYSSAKYYYLNEKNFPFLKDLFIEI